MPYQRFLRCTAQHVCKWEQLLYLGGTLEAELSVHIGLFFFVIAMSHLMCLELRSFGPFQWNISQEKRPLWSDWRSISASLSRGPRVPRGPRERCTNLKITSTPLPLLHPKDSGLNTGTCTGILDYRRSSKNAPGRGDEVVYGFNFWTTDIDCFLRWIQLLQISTCIISCQSMHRVALHNSPHVNCQSFSRSMVDWSRRCSCNHHPLLQLLIPSWLIVLVAFLDCKCCQLHKLVIHRPWMNATTWDLQTLNQHQIIKQSGQCSVHFHPHPVTPGVFLFSLQVGPFSIPMVKLTNGLVSHANDLNPSSIHWLKKSVEMNKLPQVESWPAWFFFNFLGLFLALAGFDMSGNRSVS